jgi:hypothetical protein
MRGPVARVRAVVLACVAVVAVVATSVASCTTFNGLESGTQAEGGADVAAEASDSGGGPPGYLSRTDAAKLCSRIMQCPALATDVIASTAVPVDPNNFSLCMDWLSGPIPNDRVGFSAQQQAFGCMNAAPTCTAAAACLYWEPLANNDPRCPADAGLSTPDTCLDPETLLSCANGWALHCNSAYYQSGSKCLAGMIGDAGDVGCAIGQNCVTSAGCGAFYDYCGVDNLHYALNCAFAGYTCDTAADAATVCVTGNTYMPCNVRGAQCSTDMSTVTVCDGSEVSEFDCAALGSGATCSRKDGPGRCVRPSDACSPFDMTSNVCSPANNVSVCIGGQPATFDCASIGMKCIPGAGTVSGHCG